MVIPRSITPSERGKKRKKKKRGKWSRKHNSQPDWHLGGIFLSCHELLLVPFPRRTFHNNVARSSSYYFNRNSWHGLVPK